MNYLSWASRVEVARFHWGPPLLLPILQSYELGLVLVVYKRLKTDNHKTLLYIKLESGRLRKNTFNIYVIAPKL